MRAAEGIRLVRGLRRLVRNARRQGPAGIVEEARDRLATREPRFLASLDRLVWSVPSSPYLPLLRHAGVEPGDVRSLVATGGVEGALTALRDAGVYVSYAEWLGREPVRRGSQTLTLRPDRFFNPRRNPDYHLPSGGSRTEGIPIAVSLSNFARTVWHMRLMLTAFDAWGAPTGICLPVLPSGGGVIACLAGGSVGLPVMRWFTPVDPRAPGIAARKRAANAVLPLLLRTAGASVPRPEFVAPGNPDPPLDWCRAQLDAHGRALMAGMATMVATMSRRAIDRGIALDGLVILASGEPLTPAKAAAVRRAGASVIDVYGCVQLGIVDAINCPACGDEQLHVLDDAFAVIDHPRTRPDGVTVPALLWTTLDEDAASVFLNVENDDYAELTRDAAACECVFGTAGYRTNMARVRGISKVVAGGVTVPGEVFEQLAERVLPGEFGGGPGDYQFVESDRGGRTSFVLRVAPSLGAVNPNRVLTTVRTQLQATEPGALAAASWADSEMLTVERVLPITTAAGKILPLEIMRPG